MRKLKGFIQNKITAITIWCVNNSKLLMEVTYLMKFYLTIFCYYIKKGLRGWDNKIKTTKRLFLEMIEIQNSTLNTKSDKQAIMTQTWHKRHK